MTASARTGASLSVSAGLRSQPLTVRCSSRAPLIAREDELVTDKLRIGSLAVYGYGPLFNFSRDGTGGNRFPFDGILSLGPSYSNDFVAMELESNKTWDSAVDRAYNAHLIPKNALTISVSPALTNATKQTAGKIVFGSASKADYCGPLTTFAQDSHDYASDDDGADEFLGRGGWQVQAAFKYNGKTLPILNGTTDNSTTVSKAPMQLEIAYESICAFNKGRLS